MSKSKWKYGTPKRKQLYGRLQYCFSPPGTGETFSDWSPDSDEIESFRGMTRREIWSGDCWYRAMPDKILCYLAGPYSIGQRDINTDCQVNIANELMNDGIVTPYSPLSNTKLMEEYSPRTYDAWMDYSYELLARCDALLRSDANMPSIGYHQSISKGADLEEVFAKSHDIPIFYNKESLYEFAKSN